MTKEISAMEKFQINMQTTLEKYYQNRLADDLPNIIQLHFAKHYSQTLSNNVKRGLRAKKERELAKKLSTSATSQVNESKV